jgi:hypothetical protein
MLVLSQESPGFSRGEDVKSPTSGTNITSRLL